MEPNISIIICTYNPDLKILERCLNAISSLRREDLELECFLVDNNSYPPLIEHCVVNSFLQRCPWAMLLVEKKQGLTYARMCGFKESTAHLVVFFDDDNEPDEDYLTGIIDYSQRHPHVGAFGPGIVTAEYTDNVEDWLVDYKGYFQQSVTDKEEKDRVASNYQNFYPYGTGLVLKREVLEAYDEEIINQKISTSDRKGPSLDSWGDIQMVWLALKMGYEAGKTPLLKLRHLINNQKANRRYLRRWTYGCAVGNVPARIEIFPEERDYYKSQMLSSSKGVLLCILIYLLNFYKKDVDLMLIRQIGSIDGYRRAFGQEEQPVIEWMKKWMKLV